MLSLLAVYVQPEKFYLKFNYVNLIDSIYIFFFW